MNSDAPSLWNRLRQTSAETVPASPDPLLQPRSYPIPFEYVWREAVTLADGGLRGWSLITTDDHEGMIEATAKPLIFPGTNRVTVEIGLDDDGQTFVHLRAVSEEGRAGLGTNHRHIARFLRALDATLTQNERRG